jgi:alkanesulfonate monooxygenase SsuD/methylene tetrahydromethanopterin reductase-like flavin-dependent oxidoreductase (luciferase family)
MELCVMIEGQEGVSWPQWQAIAAACEEHGIPALFRSDHYLPLQGGSAQVLDAWATVCALAATTTKLRLGTLVSPATFRHPAVLAKMAITADHVSGGRVELGLGAGWHEGEHEAFGFAFPPLRERMAELESQLETVRTHFGPDGPFDPKPVQQPLPIIIGGQAKPKSAALAARFADEYNTIFAGPDECRSRRAAVEDAWREAGRDPSTLRFSLMTGCVIGPERLARLGFDAVPPGWVGGSADELRDQLAALADAGVDRVMLQLLLHDDLEQIAIIGGLAS